MLMISPSMRVARNMPHFNVHDPSNSFNSIMIKLDKGLVHGCTETILQRKAFDTRKTITAWLSSR